MNRIGVKRPLKVEFRVVLAFRVWPDIAERSTLLPLQYVRSPEALSQAVPIGRDGANT